METTSYVPFYEKTNQFELENENEFNNEANSIINEIIEKMKNPYEEVDTLIQVLNEQKDTSQTVSKEDEKYKELLNSFKS
ncbi:unnamed protein product [Adineta ricciae]|uniref:Uncharacterized protein n=1 Tax=Adineta ricciae TaxID=249248 RepID=A0A815W8C2_ADIRI|nr:unnamed protein product [Adineta ricciae]